MFLGRGRLSSLFAVKSSLSPDPGTGLLLSLVVLSRPTPEVCHRRHCRHAPRHISSEWEAQARQNNNVDMGKCGESAQGAMKTPFKRLLFMWVIFYVTVEGDGHKGRGAGGGGPWETKLHNKTAERKG